MDVWKGKFKSIFEKNAEDLFKPIDQGGVGLDKMKQLFGEDIINPTVFKSKINTNDQFQKVILTFIKVN